MILPCWLRVAVFLVLGIFPVNSFSVSTLETKLKWWKNRFSHMSLEDISKDLVQHGYQWKKRQQLQQQENELPETSTASTRTSLVKVPGCTANVHIQLVLTSDSSTTTRNFRIIQSLQGTADALVSQGLVAVIASCVEQQSEDTIGQISAESITARLGLQQHLSPGRNDGVASLWRTLQQSLQSSSPASFTLTRPSHCVCYCNKTIASRRFI